jgi:hypothetical protein
MPQVLVPAEPRKVRRLIDLVAILAFATVFARTAFQDVPQVFPGGAKIGEVLSQLSLGYVGAWFFHLLVIVLPRRSDQRLIFRTCDKLMRGAASTGFLFMIFVAGSEYEKFQMLYPDRGALRRACARVDPNAPARSGIKRDRMGIPRPLTWREYIEAELKSSARDLRDLQPFYPYLDAETIALLNEVNGHFLRVMFEGASELGPTGEKDFLKYEQYMYEYWEVCNRLTEHRIKHIAPLAQDNRSTTSSAT